MIPLQIRCGECYKFIWLEVTSYGYHWNWELSCQIEYNLVKILGASNKLTINPSSGKTVEFKTGNLNVLVFATATSFDGSGANLTNLPASGDSNDITACLFI